MPYATKIQDDENKNKYGQNISGGSASFSTNLPGQSAGSGAKPSKGPAESGQYQNIQSYLGANKEQAGEMSNKIAGNVENEAKSTLSAADTYKAAKPQEVKSYTNNDVNAIYDNPSAFSTQDYSKLKSTGGYEGPKDYTQVQGYQPFADTSKKASESIGNLTSEGGRQQLLQSTYQKPSYSGGQQKLDQTLLQNNASTKNDFANLSAKYGDLSKLFNDTTADVGSAVNKNVQTAQANQELIPKAEQSYIEGFKNPIQQRAAQANIDNPALINRVTSDLSDDTLTQETLDRLGLSGGENLYGLNLSNYVNPNQTQVGMNDVATADERQRYSALMNLIGGSDQSITDKGMDINPITFNKEQFAKDRDAQKSEFDKYWNEGSVGSWANTVGSLGYDTSGLGSMSAKDVQAKYDAEMAGQNKEWFSRTWGPIYKKYLDNINNTYKTNRTIKGV